MNNENNRPVQTFREGAVGLSIWKRVGSNGDYYEFTLSRSFVKSENEAGYSQCFKTENEKGLQKVITDA